MSWILIIAIAAIAIWVAGLAAKYLFHSSRLGSALSWIAVALAAICWVIKMFA